MLKSANRKQSYPTGLWLILAALSFLQLVRVMAKGAQCAEDGPFFATTPRVVIQNGIAISRDIVIMPDWVLIGAMLGSFALLMVILVIGLVS